MEQPRGSGLLPPVIVIAGLVAWGGFAVGKNSGRDEAWADAGRRAVLVALRGFCAASDAALSEAQDIGTTGTDEAILLSAMAAALVDEAEMRFPGRHGEATSDFPNDAVTQWDSICSDPAYGVAPPGFSSLAGIEPDEISFGV